MYACIPGSFSRTWVTISLRTARASSIIPSLTVKVAICVGITSTQLNMGALAYINFRDLDFCLRQRGNSSGPGIAADCNVHGKRGKYHDRLRIPPNTQVNAGT